MQTLWRRIAPIIFLAVVPTVVAAQAHQTAISYLEQNQAHYADVAQEIWGFAEVGYQENQSSDLLQKQLRDAGFSVEANVAGMPTAFVASYGSGSPVIGILAEYDALPGISQTRSPVRTIRTDAAAGHACGHHLFGTGSTAAGIAVSEWLKESGQSGTIRVYGTPAEEGGAGKVYVVREVGETWRMKSVLRIKGFFS
jgi:aminobenzoyl-glutamate utilization protein B